MDGVNNQFGKAAPDEQAGDINDADDDADFGHIHQVQAGAVRQVEGLDDGVQQRADDFKNESEYEIGDQDGQENQHAGHQAAAQVQHNAPVERAALFRLMRQQAVEILGMAGVGGRRGIRGGHR